MATPRNPYVCIGDSLYDEPWDPDVKLAVVLLSCHMHRRWRADRRLSLRDVADRHVLSMGDLQHITGTRRPHLALQALARVASSVSLEWGLERGKHDTWVALKWPKWAEFNGIHSRSQDESDAPCGAPPSPASEEEKKKKKRRRREEPPQPPLETKEDSAPAERLSSGGPDDAPAPTRRSRDTIPDEIERACFAAFAAYGRPVTRLLASKTRRELMEARAREHGADALPKLVHGYIAQHRVSPEGDRYDPLKFLRPSTVFHAAHSDDYLEAYEATIASGWSPPFAFETVTRKVLTFGEQQEERLFEHVRNKYGDTGTRSSDHDVVRRIPGGRDRESG